VEFWSTDHSKQLLFKIPIPKDCFSMSLSLSPDGQRYAQRNYNKETVTVYNSMDGALIKSIPSKSKLMSFSPNGKVLALNGENGIVELWNLDSGELNTFQAHTNVVESVAFSSDSQMLAYASEDGTLRLWRIDGTPQQIFQRHSSWVTSVCFSPDGQMLASASEDKTVRLWSINGGILHTFHGHSRPVYSVAFSPDGQMLASADLEGTIILWNLNLEDLLKRGCDWLRDYLKTNPNISESDRYLCDGVGTQK
jgi:WD40 repeat protein